MTGARIRLVRLEDRLAQRAAAAETGPDPAEVARDAEELLAAADAAGALSPEATKRFIAARLGIDPTELEAEARRLAQAEDPRRWGPA